MMTAKKYTLCGETKTINEWSAVVGCKRDAMTKRIRLVEAGEMSESEAIEKIKVRYLTHNGETHRPCEWAKILGLRKNTFGCRLAKFDKGEIDEAVLFYKGDKSKDTTRSRAHIEYDGVKMSIADWARKLGITYAQMAWRVRRIEEGTLSKDVAFDPTTNTRDINRRSVIVEHNGQRLTVAEWARELGITFSTMQKRNRDFQAGKMTEEQCFQYGRRSLRRIRIKVGNREYTAIGLAEKLDIPVSTLYARLERVKAGTMNRDLLFHKGRIDEGDRDHSWQKKYEFNGEKMSLAEIGLAKGMCTSNIVMRIRNGWDVSEAIESPRVSFKERGRRIGESFKRNRRVRELKRIGLMV